jgi:hypothetical protein
MNGLLGGSTVRGVAQGDSIPQIFIPDPDRHVPPRRLLIELSYKGRTTAKAISSSTFPDPRSSLRSMWQALAR